MRKTKAVFFFLITHHLSLFEFPISHIREVAGDGCGCGHRGADEVRAPALALPALEVSVARRGASLARHERVGVHAQTHRAAGLAPLETRVAEYRIKPFRLRRALDGL